MEPGFPGYRYGSRWNGSKVSRSGRSGYGDGWADAVVANRW